MSTSRRPRVLPRGQGLSAADDSPGRLPPWLVGATLAVAAALPAPSAAADAGLVELQNGGRVTGNLLAVLPGDRVVIQLADGTTLTFTWAEIRFVFDGPRVYDAAGNVGSLPGASERSTAPPLAAAPAAVPTTTGTGVRIVGPASPDRGHNAIGADASETGTFGQFLRSRGVRPGDYGELRLDDPYAFYRALPTRMRSVNLGVFGGLILAGGIITTSMGGAFSSCGSTYYGSCYREDARAWLLGWGLPSLGSGVAMLARSARMRRVRRAGIQMLQGLGYPVFAERFDFDVAFDAGADRFVTNLRLAF